MAPASDAVRPPSSRAGCRPGCPRRRGASTFNFSVSFRHEKASGELLAHTAALGTLRWLLPSRAAAKGPSCCRHILTERHVLKLTPAAHSSAAAAAQEHHEKGPCVQVPGTDRYNMRRAKCWPQLQLPRRCPFPLPSHLPPVEPAPPAAPISPGKPTVT